MLLYYEPRKNKKNAFFNKNLFAFSRHKIKGNCKAVSHSTDFNVLKKSAKKTKTLNPLTFDFKFHAQIVVMVMLQHSLSHDFSYCKGGWFLIKNATCVFLKYLNSCQYSFIDLRINEILIYFCGIDFSDFQISRVDLVG